jgi:DNA polymerase-1
MKNKPKRLVLLDGNAIVHRAYHGLPPLTTKTGETVHAVYGFALTLLSVLEKFQPEYVIATFDLPGGTFRDDLYEEYKAHRQAAPDDLYAQIPVIQEMVTAFGIPVVTKENFEADDCIGTLSLKGKNEGLEVIIVTGDTDTLQLVDEDVKVFTMRKSIKDTIVYEVADVVTKYGLAPSQLVDYKGLAGDSSDNIPGVRGVGPKTAQTLLSKHQNLEGVYAHLDENKGKLLENLTADKENAFLSRDLGTIRRDVDIDLDLSAAKLDDYDATKAEAFLKHYEFYSLLKRLPKNGNTPTEAAVTTKPTKKQKVQLLTDAASAKAFFAKANAAVAVVLEHQAESLFGGGLAAVTLCSTEAGVARLEWQHEDAQKIFLAWVSDAVTHKIFFDAKKQLHVLVPAGATVAGEIDDVQVLAYLAEVTYDKTLEPLAEVLHVPGATAAEKLLGCYTVLLEKLTTIAKEQGKEENLLKVYTELEKPLIPVLFGMEARGIFLNQKTFAALSAELHTSLERLAKDIHSMAGKEFNINSPKQLAEVLFVDLAIPTLNIKKNKTGISTASSELQKLAEYPIAQKIEEYRELFKLKSTYLDAFPHLVDQHSKLHTTYQQTVAATGRLSSLDPNLQNIPARGEWSERIRGAFEATPGFVLVGADYSQIELRIMAHLSGDVELTRAFTAGEDVHTATAAVVYKVEPKDVTSDMRRQAKVFNFGIMYGMGAFGLAQAADIPQAQAKEFIADYFAKFSGVKTYIEKIIEETKTLGYQETEIGRRRHIPEIQSSNNQVMKAGERMAVNMPIQGLEADIVKKAMLATDALITEKFPGQVYQLLQVHDEIIFEAKEEVAESFAKELDAVMEHVYTITVPLTVEVSLGKNWGEI